MKTTYAAPAAITRGDVVHSTLSGKMIGQPDTINPITNLSGGSALSFGL